MLQIANVPQLSLTGPVVQWLIMVLMILPWLRMATWVDEDVQRIRADRVKWNALALGGGFLGVLLWLVLPFFIVGLLFYAVLAAGGLLAYALYRNEKVEPEEKVLTGSHLTSLLSGRKREKPTIEILTKVVIHDNHEKIVFPPDLGECDEEDVHTYNRVQEFLFDIVWRRASEVAMAPSGQQTRVAFVIDGVVHQRPSIPLSHAEEMIQFIKEIAGMEVEEVRRPQKGKISVECRNPVATADMELTSAGTTGGQKMVFRIIQEVARTDLAELGMPDEVLGQVNGIAQTQDGLFICAGRKGSGVTSTLYSMLRQRDVYMSTVVTLEAKPEVDLENITQHTYESDADTARALSVAVQRGLDVVMIDKCTNASTAHLIAELAAKKPVLLGMQAGDSFSALAKWVKLVGNPSEAVKVLRGVICQMLVRQLCPQCKVAYKPDSTRLAKLNLASEQIESFYRPPSPEDKAKSEAEGKNAAPDEPCPECQGSGYKGRVAVYELLALTPEIRKLIVDGATVATIRAECRKNKMLYLQEMAMKRVIDGTTSVQEVIRVTQQAAKK